jgi:ankyrin repeat protein
MAEAQALAAPVEFGPEQLMLSPELLQVLTTGNAARLVEVLSTEGQTNGQVAIDVPATAAVAAPPGQAARSCLLGVTSNGNTALHLAASRGHAEVTALLCEKAPSLVATRNRGLDTPLHCAAKAGHWRVAACLLSAMRAGGEEATAALRARNCLGATALYEAVRFNHVALVDLLMAEAPELSAVTTENGSSPLYLAASLPSRRIVQAIIRPSLDGTPSPASYSGPEGRTALHAATAAARGIRHLKRVTHNFRSFYFVLSLLQ